MRDSVRSLYDYDVAMLYQYGDSQRLVQCNSVRRAGYEIDLKHAERGTVHDSKLEESISRAKSMIKELAYCNPWDYFITLTIDPSKYDRTCLKDYYKVFSQWIRNYRRKFNLDISYIFVPELHHDGHGWHMHGLIHGLPIDHVRLFTLNEKLPMSIVQLLNKGQQVFDWPFYREKFGYVSLSPVRSHKKVSSYITKYITKDAMNSIKELNAKTYYCSQGLKRKELIKKGTLRQRIPLEIWSTYGYVGDYSKSMMVPESWDFKTLIDDV